MTNQDLERRLLDALAKLEEYDEGASVSFTDAQAEALIEVAKWWVALQGISMFGGALGSGVKWLAFMVGIWIAFKAGFLEWLSQNMGAGQ